MMAERCPRADALAAATDASTGAPRDRKARQREVVDEVLRADAGEEDLRVARHLSAGKGSDCLG